MDLTTQEMAFWSLQVRKFSGEECPQPFSPGQSHYKLTLYEVHTEAKQGEIFHVCYCSTLQLVAYI